MFEIICFYNCIHFYNRKVLRSSCTECAI